MVALAHLVGNVLEAVAGIHIADEALRPAARGAGGFLLPPPRQLPGLKLVTIIGVHSMFVIVHFNDFVGDSRLLLEPLYI